MADDSPKIIDFQFEAMSRLRAKVDALGEAHASLLQVARSRGDSQSRVHTAVLAALDAGSPEHFVHVITQDWVDILGLDAVAVALETSPEAVRLAPPGLQFIGPGQLGAWLDGRSTVSVRDVELGLPLFGPAADLIKSQALIRLPMDERWPRGLLALGSRTPHAFEKLANVELLSFLGAVSARCLNHWLSLRA
ncbi:MAG TPA: DUF484 family protein [Pedomonas sp.]|uniref:DUF484 family protein n=1 Tax=Pedomonas sp. TaxID=2976421 RepID=UPI002F422D24